jgi:hypothetical protein
VDPAKNDLVDPPVGRGSGVIRSKCCACGSYVSESAKSVVVLNSLSSIPLASVRVCVSLAACVKYVWVCVIILCLYVAGVACTRVYVCIMFEYMHMYMCVPVRVYLSHPTPPVSACSSAP